MKNGKNGAEQKRIEGQLVLAMGGSRSFMGLWLGTAKELRAAVRGGELVELREVLEVSSSLELVPVAQQQLVSTPGRHGDALAWHHVSQPHYIDGAPCAIPRYRLMVFGYYLVSDCVPVVRDLYVAAYQAMVHSGHQAVAELTRQQEAAARQAAHAQQATGAIEG